MSLRYFCTSHSEEIHTNELEALRCWTALIQRGIKAYVECRIDAAYIYLGAALDVALIRENCEKNNNFCETHTIKPCEFLLQRYIVDQNFNQARKLLKRIKNNCEKNSFNQFKKYDNFFAKHYRDIEISEKKFMEGETQSQIVRSKKITKLINIIH